MHPKPYRTKDPWLLDKIRKLPCVVCGDRPSDPAHIRSRGAGGKDTWDNLTPLCRGCHQTEHQIGIYTFALRYPQFRLYLEQLGWELSGNRVIKKL